MPRLKAAACAAARVFFALCPAALAGPPNGLGADGCAADAVSSIGCTVADLDRSVAFYTAVLDFQPQSEQESVGERLERVTGVFGARCRTARLKLGDETLELTQYLAPEGRPVPADSRSNDHWFQHIAIVVSDMERAYRRLREHRARHASNAPQTLPDWNVQAGGISAFYFKDPDGHPLEIIQFPAGKGDAKWQRTTERLFLGIDHTAIVVADTDRSIRFYRDTLGMRIVGASENYGTEQEHLNGLRGARLRITALRAGAGPGVELLQYIAPSGGRAYPADAMPNDLLTWTTTFLAPCEVRISSRAAESAWVSAGWVRDDVDGSRAARLRDPDGHILEMVVREPDYRPTDAPSSK